jgi:hypothetical protein
LADGRGSLTYLAIDKKGNSQLEALEHTTTLEKLPGLLSGDNKKLHALGSSFVEAAKNKGKSFKDIMELDRKAYNTNRSIRPEPSEAGEDTKLSELDFSPLDMTDRFFPGSSLHMLADALE